MAFKAHSLQCLSLIDIQTSRYDEEHGVRDAFKTELEKVWTRLDISKIILDCLHSEIWSLGPTVCKGWTDLH